MDLPSIPDEFYTTVVSQYIKAVVSRVGTRRLAIKPTQERLGEIEEIAYLICGSDGCKNRCTEVCEAIRFLIGNYLTNYDDQPRPTRVATAAFQMMLLDFALSDYS